MLTKVYADFDTEAFLARALDGFDDLELTPRARQVSGALAATLPEDRERALRLVVAALGDPEGWTPLTGMEGFVYLPFVYFVADHGLDHVDTALWAQHVLTRRFTAEFSIRAYLEQHPEVTLARLREWTDDPNVHVRRLVSEGTRPRLPWASRLRRFEHDPTPVLALLERLKDDPEEYVRRSVANNLNDIAKDHPDRVVEVAARWWAEGDTNRRRLVRHGLRSLIKAGHAGALGVLGYGRDTPVEIRRVNLSSERIRIGDSIRVEVEVVNPSAATADVLIDLVVDFVKANGETRPKVFKGGALTLAPQASGRIRKTVSLLQHSTRTHYPGTHRVDVLLNGVTHPGPSFDVSE